MGLIQYINNTHKKMQVSAKEEGKFVDYCCVLWIDKSKREKKIKTNNKYKVLFSTVVIITVNCNFCTRMQFYNPHRIWGHTVDVTSYIVDANVTQIFNQYVASLNFNSVFLCYFWKWHKFLRTNAFGYYYYSFFLQKESRGYCVFCVLIWT